MTGEPFRDADFSELAIPPSAINPNSVYGEQLRGRALRLGNIARHVNVIDFASEGEAQRIIERLTSANQHLTTLTGTPAAENFTAPMLDETHHAEADQAPMPPQEKGDK